MFKHVASENGPLVLILQSYSQIFIVKHIDWNLVELIWTTENCENLWKTVVWWQSFQKKIAQHAVSLI